MNFLNSGDPDPDLAETKARTDHKSTKRSSLADQSKLRNQYIQDTGKILKAARTNLGIDLEKARLMPRFCSVKKGDLFICIF